MRKTLTALALAATVLATAPALAAQARPATATRDTAEPSFDGRSLDDWIGDLKGAAPYTRSAAAFAIASMGAKGGPAVPALIPLLKDEYANVRYPAAIALGEIGPPAKAAIPALREVVTDDRQEDVSHVARKAIRKIDPEAEVPQRDD